jgi:hypothetical protein
LSHASIDALQPHLSQVRHAESGLYRAKVENDPAPARWPGDGWLLLI